MDVGDRLTTQKHEERSPVELRHRVELPELDESLVKHLLSKVTVFEGKLVFEFKSGVTVEIEN